MDLEAFAAFNRQLFHDPQAEAYDFHPVPDPATSAITPAELSGVLTRHFKANRSQGFSPLPLQLLKHLGEAGVTGLASFLSTSAIS